MISLVALAAGAYAQKPRNIAPSRFNFFSKEQDIQLGKEAAAEIEKQIAVVTQPEVHDYVNRIAAKLVAQPEADQYPYTFKVVYDKTINAFALPGGPAYIHTGLILAAENEAQIAGVIAHEISHVALRHGTSQVTKANATQLLAGFGGAMLGGGLLGQLAQIGAGLGANSLLLKFSRGAETDADLLGARMMAKAGYDPIEMATFFQKLEEEEKRSGRAVPQFLSDHPSPGNRVKAVSAEVKMMPARQYTKGDSAQLARVKQVIQALPVPPRANTNFRAAGNPQAARPSTRMQRYQSRGLTFVYPSNWQVFQSQQSNEITIASREGILEVNGNAEIGYGAIVGLQQIQGGTELDRDTQNFLRQLMQQNRNMQPSGEAVRRIQIAGAPALLHLMFNSSPYPNVREVDAIVTVQHPQGLFYMILIAPEPEYQAAQPVFDQMIQSIQFAR
ncbi:MAG: M48 family metallopeptidase [Bryobacteraceae bacterium]|nr:M48 family metallopeptidase [Bryobacteraceae bacterium]MDW8377513.1 M48 family metallopeptidase [Bryobacterales bacterium]